ncbi:MAG: hypothetical protein ACYDAR_13515 [Thermomicrobiales bacterium]
MVATRRTFLPLVLVAIFLAFGTVSVFAKDKETATPVSGSSTGTSQITNPPTSPTDPNGCAPNTGGGKVCHFDVSGTFTASPLGSGTYQGKVTLDYRSYTSASPCAKATGHITFTNAAGDKVYTVLAPGSKVCETMPPSNIHTETLTLKITGGTGQFEDATGTIHSNGTTTDVPGNPGMHTDSATLTGSITLDHGNGNGCGDGGGDHGNDHCGDGHGNDNNGGND